MSHLILLTFAEYEKLSPGAQGYAIYMQAELPGSELKNHQECPYLKDSNEYKEWHRGKEIAAMAAQDSEE